MVRASGQEVSRLGLIPISDDVTCYHKLKNLTPDHEHAALPRALPGTHLTDFQLL